MKKFVSCTLFAIAVLLSLSTTTYAQSASNLELHGWAWSWTTGWIKLSSRQLDSSGQPLATHDNHVEYSVTFDGATGVASGWAWSPNIGWISFNEADLAKSPACTGPNGSAGRPATLVVDGTGYKLTGTARAISPTQSSAGWDLLSSNGNWNGCIYFDNTSLPSNPCSVTFGVKFLSQAPTYANSFVGQGSAWNAAGALAGPVSCSSPIGFGGLSFIEFAGVFKSILKQEQSEIDITLNDNGWTGVCKDSDGDSLDQTVTAEYTVSPASGTTCYWHDSTSAAVPTGSKSFTNPQNGNKLITLSCYNPATSNKDASNPKIVTIGPYSCTECSDGLDNDTDGTIDIDDISCHKDCLLTGDYTPEVGSETAG
jgi:hypothetical protein